VIALPNLSASSLPSLEVLLFSASLEFPNPVRTAEHQLEDYRPSLLRAANVNLG
jgi:hypothetical protein